VRWILCASHCASRLDNTGGEKKEEGKKNVKWTITGLKEIIYAPTYVCLPHMLDKAPHITHHMFVCPIC